MPQTLPAGEFNELSTLNKIVNQCYYLKETEYTLIEDLESDKIISLGDFFRSLISIFIIDNGDGMTEDVILKNWMTIGTGHKATSIFSDSGRVRSGAKGIKRFSLDRLGNIGRMITFPKENNGGHDWKVTWSDFEAEGAVIGQVMADLDPINNVTYKDTILSLVANPRILQVVQDPSIDFSKGTTLRINSVRDDWDDKSISRLFSNLEILTPPDGR